MKKSDWKSATITIKAQDGKFTLNFTSSGTKEAMSSAEAYGLFTMWIALNARPSEKANKQGGK